VATYRSALGVLLALREQLTKRMAVLLGGNPNVVLLGSQDLAGAAASEALGIYLHRIAVDPFSRNRYLPAVSGHHTARAELPVNLHLLLIGWSTNRESEVNFVAAAMQVIGSAMVLDAANVGLADPGWGNSDSVQVMPDDMSTEDLMRMWDSLPGDYRLCTPYIIKSVRLAPDVLPADAPLVTTRIFPVATEGGG
jgi:hypothetical protein